MKNNFRKVIFLGIFALALTSCSQDGDNNPKEPTKQVEEVKDKGEKEDPKKVEAEEKKKEDLANEEEKEDNKESSKENVEDPTPPEDKDSDGSYLDLDGQYSSSLMANKEGEVDQMGHGTSYDFYVDEETNTLTVKGSLSYNENIDDINAYENANEIPKGEYTFKLDENTILRSTGGTNEPKPYTAEEFNNLFDKVKDSGLGLVIVVENGVVKTVSIAS